MGTYIRKVGSNCLDGYLYFVGYLHVFDGYLYFREYGNMAMANMLGSHIMLSPQFL